MVIADTQIIPLKTDLDGVIRVGNTRVRLATVVYAFNEGFTAEEIVSQYPALSLADVYAVISYYLNNQSSLDKYLAQQQATAEAIRQEVTSKPDYQRFRAQLLQRRQQKPQAK
ncbi:MAG: DUF433 domain-containing protein [Anaerolineae bacterium]|nr:DUF433 domain-containing protein [Anaerolineae bacterium]